MAHTTEASKKDVGSIVDKQRDKRSIVANDYTKNMFEEGHNRTASKAEIESGPEYDRVAHTPGNYIVPDQEVAENSSDGATTAATPDTFHSRDGTDASGVYDEEGGPLGGTEEELDDLETAGTPVDRTPHMRD